MTGAVLEAFVGTEIAKQITWNETRPMFFHYRTHTQHEVDFVLEGAGGRLVGIEVKKVLRRQRVISRACTISARP